MLRFETSKAHFVAFKTLMSTLFETPVLFSIFTFHWDLQNESLDRERTEKTFREEIFERHYFICLHNKCMRQCMTGLRTDVRTYVRTYGYDVITKFSELHGLLPFSLTNGCSAINTYIIPCVCIALYNACLLYKGLFLYEGMPVYNEL